MKISNLRKKQIGNTFLGGIIVVLFFLIFPDININASESPKILINSPVNNYKYNQITIDLNGTIINKELAEADATLKLLIFDSDNKELRSTENVENWSFPPQQFTDGTQSIKFILKYVYKDGREDKEIDSQTINFFIVGTHGEISTNTQSCGNCHSTHVANGSHLRGGSNGNVDNGNYCISCHKSEGDANFQSHRHSKIGSGTDTCTSCHNPHANWPDQNPNSLKDFFEYTHKNDSIGFIRSTEVLCETCHENNAIPIQWNSHYRVLSFKDFASAIGDENQDSSLCLSCHDGSMEGATNIKQYYDDASIVSGHVFNAMNNNNSNFQIPCSDCHVTHGSSNIKGLKVELGHEGIKVYNEFTGNWDTNKERDFCITCHNKDTKVYGNSMMDLSNNIGHEFGSNQTCSSCHGDTNDPVKVAHAPISLKPKTETGTQIETKLETEIMEAPTAPSN
jgi:hypothetical protein